MKIKTLLSISTGKSVAQISMLSRRSGSTWPGHVALKLDSKLVSKILNANPNLKIVLIAGTNGKTTTAKLIQETLEMDGKRVFRNATGANLINGITSTLIRHTNLHGKINYDVAVFEIDENSLPLILSELSDVNCHLSIVLLNLFRDQLDRYGEVNTIAAHWLSALQSLDSMQRSDLDQAQNPQKLGPTLVVNGDDPMLTYVGQKSGLNTYFFGLNEKYMAKKDAPHDVDFLYCPNCENKLIYSKRSYSHMGAFICAKCGFKHQKTATYDALPNPMFGIYNKYNINASALLLEKAFSIKLESIKQTLEKFSPAFGRQEVIEYNGKKIFLLLSKNPTGFNQSIEAILEQDSHPNVLLLLNDRVPDGRDVSWIWDVEFEKLQDAKTITISGDRAYDMGLRIKYIQKVQNSEFKIHNEFIIMNSRFSIYEKLTEALENALHNTSEKDVLYVLATYSAMLETRKILKGKSIL